MKKLFPLFVLLMAGHLLKAQTNTATGTNAGNAGTNNSSFGYSAGDVVTGQNNSFIGTYSGQLVTSASYNSFLGSLSGFKTTTGNANSFFGYQAGYNNTTGISNLFAGSQAGYNSTTGTYNVSLGYFAGYSDIASSYNVSIGANSRYGSTAGTYNVALGYNSGYSATGNYNVFTGASAGYNNTGNNNLFSGQSAGSNSGSGANNTYLGYQAGYSATGSNNVFLGQQAGTSETGSNKLYIENSTNTTTPLLYGDFSTRQLSINAKPTGSYTLTVGGTVHATAFYANGVLISPTQSQWTTSGSNIYYSTGNVGIGTTTTNANLQFGNVVNNRKMVMYEEVNNDHQFYGLGINGNTLRFQIPAAGRAFRFFSANDAASSTEVFTIQGDSKVGINTSTPRGALDVASQSDIWLTSNGANSESQSIFIPGHTFFIPYGGSNVAYLQARRSDNSGSTAFRFRTYNAGNMTEAMHIEGNGNVGIGAMTPTGKLEVNGRLVIDNVGSGGPLGSGSLLSFSSGGSDVSAIQENWGLNLNGSATAPVKVTNTSLLVGYVSSGINYGQGNLLAAGKVGIGTPNPHAQLQLGSVTGNRKLVLYEDADNDHQFHGFGTNSGTFRFQIPSSANAYRFFRGNDATTSTEVFTIQGDGNVGVGTAAPAYPLQVVGKIGSNGLFLDATTPAINTNQNAQYLHIYNHLSAANGLKAGGILVADDYQYAGPGKNDLIVKGKVGIGTPLSSNPNNYTLAVNGQIGAKDVRVEASSATWPDYVFEKDYHLPTLAEVETYLQTNKHLKEVPSAKEIADKGHSLSDMDALLLKKIEELTLYVIDQNKQMMEQNQKLEAQQQEILSLKKQLTKKNK